MANRDSIYEGWDSELGAIYKHSGLLASPIKYDCKILVNEKLEI
jgi:hypothetical protein